MTNHSTTEHGDLHDICSLISLRWLISHHKSIRVQQARTKTLTREDLQRKNRQKNTESCERYRVKIWIFGARFSDPAGGIVFLRTRKTVQSVTLSGQSPCSLLSRMKYFPSHFNFLILLSCCLFRNWRIQSNCKLCLY